MKILKKTILFCLSLGSTYDAPNQAPFEFTYELLYTLIPYAPVSIRGAVMALRDASIVSVFQRAGTTRVSLTSIGREALRAAFPAFRTVLNRRDRPWTVCVFLPSPNGTKKRKDERDVHVFRSVREELLHTGFFPLERGVYVLPKSVPEDFIGSLKASMLSRLIIFETRKMVLGDERSIIRSLFNMPHLLYSRSSIMKTLDTIGIKSAEKTRLHPQTKESFVTLIPKLMEFFAEDVTIPDLYFPQDIMLSDIKALLFQVSSEILPKL